MTDFDRTYQEMLKYWNREEKWWKKLFNKILGKKTSPTPLNCKNIYLNGKLINYENS